MSDDSRDFACPRRNRISPELTMVMSTLNSERHIDLILKHYASIDLPITVFIDSKSTDGTAAICTQLLGNVFEIENPTWRIEYALEKISRQVGTPWVLRLDDDELPSLEMIEFVGQVIKDGIADTVGFPRYQCSVSRPGEMLFHRKHDPFQVHRQWRLYRVDRMKYINDIHTPGFVRDGGVISIDAPAYASMIHLDWIVHDFNERQLKVQRYDADTPGMGSIQRNYYLADEFPDFRGGFSPLRLAEFDDLARELATRFPERTVDV